MSANILLFDIETSPNLAYVWGKYEQDAIDFKEEWQLLCFAFKWFGEKTINVVAQPDFRSNREESVVKRLHQLFNQADVVVAHNGRSFDIKKANAKFIEFGLTPPKAFDVIDTRQLASRHFKFNSNKLDDLGKLLGLGRKQETGGFDLWLGCMANDKSAWDKMKRYNKQDVALLEKVYLALRAWDKTPPNMALMKDKPKSCPCCGSDKVHKSGTRALRTRLAQRMRCGQCGHNWQTKYEAN